MVYITCYAPTQKTTLPNPAILEEAKDYSQELPRDGNAPELTENQARGHKATLKNPMVSDEAKVHSLKVLNGEVPPVEPKDEARVLAGHKAALSNPNVGTAAKVNSLNVLVEHDALATCD